MLTRIIIFIVIVLAIIAGGFYIWLNLNRNKNRGPVNLEESLRDEKQRSRIILESIDDGVMLIDKEGVIQLFNPGAEKITGWPAGEAKGLDYHSVIKLVNDKGEIYTNAEDPIARCFAGSTQTIRDNTAVLVTRAGKHVSTAFSVTPLFDNNTVLSGITAIFRDVTQEREDQQRRSEFISTASHEMRTPVAAIEGYLALALNDKVSGVDSRARNYLEKAHESTERLGKLFQDLLTSAKAEDGRLASHPVLIEMGGFLEQLTNDLRFAADKKGLAMEFIFGNTSQTIDATRISHSEKIIRPYFYVKVDPDRFREVITNLFDNAVKYTDTGKITIGLTGDAQVAQIFIRDTGAGIPNEDIPHLFEKFYRVDNSTTRTVGGTGLGLYISRKIIELYEGKIWVESTLGKGSTFYINLPRITSEHAMEEKQREASTPNANTITSLTTPVVQ